LTIFVHLHDKTWLVRRPNELATAYVGSSNLSKAALVDGFVTFTAEAFGGHQPLG
jgi:HKD family nuclease